MARTQKTVKVVAGGAIVAQFSSEAQAKRFQKELKANGVSSKLHIKLGTPPDREGPMVELPKKKGERAEPKKKAPSKRSAPGRGPNPIDEESMAKSIRAGIRKGCGKEGMDEKDFSTAPERSGSSLHTVVEGPDGVKAQISVIHGDKWYSYEVVGPRNRLDATGFSIPEDEIREVVEGLAESVVSMIRTEIERRRDMKRGAPERKDPSGGRAGSADGPGR